MISGGKQAILASVPVVVPIVPISDLSVPCWALRPACWGSLVLGVSLHTNETRTKQRQALPYSNWCAAPYCAQLVGTTRSSV